MFIVMCRTADGITGLREQPLKANGKVVKLDLEDAENVATELCDRLDAGAKTASVHYWVERDPDYDGAPWCSYGHKTEAACDCGPLADND